MKDLGKTRILGINVVTPSKSEPCTVIIHARYTAEIKVARYDITTQL